MASLRKRGKKWYFAYIDAEGTRIERPGCSDKRSTEQMAAAAEAEVARIRAGLVDPKSIGYRCHDARSLVGHLEDWHAFLIGKGSTTQHANLSRNRAKTLIDNAKAERIQDLTVSRIQAALKAVRDTGVSLRSVHHYKRAIKGFSRWLWRDGRAREDTLAHLTSPNPETDRRHVRRALSPEELSKLIHAAEQGPVVFRLSGADRAMLYWLAMGTGFRAGELRSLTPESFDLDGEPPTVTVRAGFSKRRREDVLPIRPELATVLRPWLATKKPGQPVFGELTRNTADMLKVDLKAAKIPYRDVAKRVADFHALRHSYITLLALSGAPIKIVQSLARHSTPTLTLGVYSHVGLNDQAGALHALPAPVRGVQAPEAPRDGKESADISDHFAAHLPHGGGGSGRSVALPGGVDCVNLPTSQASLMKYKPLKNKGFGGPWRLLTATGKAEGVGFEPTVGLTLQRFSRPSR